MIQRHYFLRSIVPNISNIEITCLGNLGESILKTSFIVNVKTSTSDNSQHIAGLDTFTSAGYQNLSFRLPSSYFHYRNKSHLQPSKQDQIYNLT